MNKIELTSGLEVSLKVLKHLKKIKHPFDILVGTFTNCREVGLTYMINGYYEGEKYKSLPMDLWFTFCTYEHRNSDNIIVNGKQGYIANKGELSYIGESKYEYLASFKYDQHKQAAVFIIEQMNKIVYKNILPETK